MGPMSKLLAFLFGFTIVVAHVPAWSQPSIEPKSVMLLVAGALAWGWLAWKGRPMAHYPGALLLPVGWLLLSAFWSPAPFFGLQRIIWLLAAMGVGTLLSEEGHFPPFMKGFLAGTGIHASLIVLQWIPPIRALLPPSLGADPFQGIGRGLFHNTNMAALPLVIVVGWLLLSERGRPWLGHLCWALPVLTLTQSRLGMGVCSGIAAYSVLRQYYSTESANRTWFKTVPLLILAFAWSLTAHRWGWLLPAGGTFLAVAQKQKGTGAVRFGRFTKLLPAIGLSLAILAGLATRAPKSASQTLVQGTLIQGDVSLSQRLSYYRVAALAFLDHPFTGQGLGSARPIYPQYVDRNRPAAEIAYGDFQRPNNLHSEPLEWLVEGGLPVVIMVLLGLWLDRNSSHALEARSTLLVPVALVALLDFPFHNPLGLLWVGVTLAPLAQATEGPTGRATRFLHGITALGLLVLAGLQVRVAALRPGIERQFLASAQPSQTLEGARSLWKCYPFAPDLFDLYSKATIQKAAATPDASTTQELDQLLKSDPFDHHLLLARAQVARRSGDQPTAQSLLNRYAAVAPRDPDRYLRLAKTALEQGKPESARQLILEAQRQPGFSPRHARLIEELSSPPRSWSGPGYHP